MNQTRRSRSRLLCFILAALFFGTGQAQARRRGLMIISTGTTHSEIGSIKADMQEELAAAANTTGVHLDTVGFQYSHFGIFWLDIWNWGGEYIAYNKVSEDGSVITPAQAASLLGVEELSLSKPLNYRMPFGLFLVAGLVLLKFVPRFLAKRKQAAAVPQWSPSPQAAPNYEAPSAPPGGGRPPMPPPLPPEQR